MPTMKSTNQTRSYRPEESRSGIVAMKPANKEGRATRCGVGAATGGNQAEYGTDALVTDAEPGKRHSGWAVHAIVATHTWTAQPEGQARCGRANKARRRVSSHHLCPSTMAEPALCRHIPMVGTGCPKRARSDLCGHARGNGNPYRDTRHGFAIAPEPGELPAASQAQLSPWLCPT